MSEPRRLWMILTVTLATLALGMAPPNPDASRSATEALRRHLKADSKTRGALADQPFAAVPLTRTDADDAERLLRDDHQAAIRRDRAAEMDERKLRIGDMEMKFHYEVFGAKLSGGRSLYISMHGGGNAPPRVNESQWENQKKLYKIEEGVYLAPRAPTNTWNLWHQAHIDPLFDRLIENLIVFEDVNPNKVYLLGYSAGGDGVYQLAPRMADRFAAASMMAGHPNEASPLGLRNIGFAIHVGGRDAAYNRNRVAGEWGKQLDDLRKADPSGYPHVVKIHAEKGHWMDREDAEALPWMAKFTRDPLPKRVVWRQDDVTHERFYWLAVPESERKAGTEIIAERDGRTIRVRSETANRVIVRLNDRMADLDQLLTIIANQRSLAPTQASRTIRTMARSLAERGDPQSMFRAEVEAVLPQEAPTP